uniref:Class I SAM-dependent methyltransferase n=1 Tax=candidate division WOR-3 bacterium TaxID=2052148 RepID=A0A7C6A898_UNCW3
MEEVLCFRCQKKGELLFYHQKYPIVKCPICDQIFTGKKLISNELKDFYNDARYFKGMYGESKYHPSQIWHRIVARKRLKLIAQFQAKGKLLDIGSGYGIFLAVAKHYGWLVWGVELSKPACDYASSLYQLNIFNGEVEVANYPDQFFDVITSWDVLEHIPNPVIFLKGVRRIIKKSGYLALSVPNVDSFAARLIPTKWWSLRPEQHLWHFSPKTLSRLLFEQGFEPVLCAKSPFNGPNFTRIDNMVVLAQPITGFNSRT